jgi:hypothetical protein
VMACAPSGACRIRPSAARWCWSASTPPTRATSSFTASMASQLRVVPERGGLVTGWRADGQERLSFDQQRFADPADGVRGGGIPGAVPHLRQPPGQISWSCPGPLPHGPARLRAGSALAAAGARGAAPAWSSRAYAPQRGRLGPLPLPLIA